MGTRQSWWTLIVVAVALGIIGATECRAGAVSAAKADTPFLVGIGIHLADDTRAIAESLALIQQAGVEALRDDATWARVEQERSLLKVPPRWDQCVDLANKRGIQPLLILDYGNPLYGNGGKPTSEGELEAFASYARFVAEHFKGRVRYYEIWNEWNHTTGNTTPGTPEDYVRLAERVYPAIKTVDPGARVLTGAVTARGIRDGFLGRIMELGVLRYADGLSVHTYLHSRQDRRPADWLAWMVEVGTKLRAWNGGKSVPVYITEMGWPTHAAAIGVSPNTQAEYLAQLFLLARTLPFLKGLWWYDLQDDGWDPKNQEHNFGVVRHDLTPKPAYYALADVAPLAARAEYHGRIANDKEGFVGLRFRRADDTDVWALWCAHEAQDCQVVLETEKVTPIRIGEVGRPAVPLSWQPFKKGSDVSEGYRLSLTVGGMPWLLEGDLSKVGIADIRPLASPRWQFSSRALWCLPGCFQGFLQFPWSLGVVIMLSVLSAHRKSASLRASE